LTLTAAVLYYLVVMPANRLKDRFDPPRHDPVIPKHDCPECLSSIPVDARRCAYCTAVLPAAEPGPGRPATPDVPAQRDA